MFEVGIPVYKARNTLSAALDSLVAQTKKNFIVCLSIDGDNENYDDIIKTYQDRGLKIRFIKSEINGGPGVARQRILDTTQCDYITFLDADDLFTPRAVEILYPQAKLGGYDVLKGSFIREMPASADLLLNTQSNNLTWMHAKSYRVDFLRENDIRFRDDLWTEEDAYFNVIVWHSTTKIGLNDEPVYIWRNNKESVTRKASYKEYFLKNHPNYIHSQVEALKWLHAHNHVPPNLFITNTLINIYYFYMQARFYQCNELPLNDCLITLRDEDWMQKWLTTGENWIELLQNIKPGEVYDNEFVIFFEETFNKWAFRLLRREE